MTTCGYVGLCVLVYSIAFIASAGYYGCKEQGETPKWWTIVFAPLVVVCWLILVLFFNPIKR